MPSIPKIIGSNRMQALWKTNVRKKEIIAEVRPSFRAVKKPEAKIPNPIKQKDNAKILKPEMVRLNNSAS